MPQNLPRYLPNPSRCTIGRESAGESRKAFGQLALKKKWIRLEYECLPNYCSSCGIIGHVQASCPSNQSVETNTCPTTVANSRNKAAMDVSMTRSTSNAPSVNTGVGLSSSVESVKTGLGPWTDVSYRRNSKKNWKGRIGLLPMPNGKLMSLDLRP